MEQTRQKWAGHGIVHPVEELFELRAQIRALKSREAELCGYFLNRAGARESTGPFHRVQVTKLQRRILVKSRLPQDILDDPRFYESRSSRQVQVLRLEDGAAPGFSASLMADWPATAGPNATPPNHAAADDFEVIEPFWG